MSRSALEQAYLSIDAAISALDLQAFVNWLTQDHLTIMLDGSTRDYAFYSDPQKWDGFHSAFAAHIPDQIELKGTLASVFTRTFGVHDKGRKFEIRGRCRDEWICNGSQWKIRRRFKLEQGVYEGDTCHLHRVAPLPLTESRPGQVPFETLSPRSQPVGGRGSF
jgi:hypothetical protein